MSANDPKRTLPPCSAMSAFGGEADIGRTYLRHHVERVSKLHVSQPDADTDLKTEANEGFGRVTKYERASI